MEFINLITTSLFFRRPDKPESVMLRWRSCTYRWFLVACICKLLQEGHQCRWRVSDWLRLAAKWHKNRENKMIKTHLTVKADWTFFYWFGWITHWRIINEDEHHVIYCVLGGKRWFINWINNSKIHTQKNNIYLHIYVVSNAAIA